MNNKRSKPESTSIPPDDAPVDVQFNELETARQLPANIQLLRMENETMMSAAAIRPRDYQQVMKQLLKLLETYPEFADDAIYCKPVGKVWQTICANPECKHRFETSKMPNTATECPRCFTAWRHVKDGPMPKKVQKYAEGLSIRAAESIRSVFRYNRLETREERQPDGSMKLFGVFVDYCECTMTSDERTVLPYYNAADGGGQTRIPEDRFVNVTVKAEKSKLRRDVIVMAIPSELKAGYFDACNTKIQSLLTNEKIDEIVKRFEDFGISQDKLEELIGRPRNMGWTQDDKLKLRKIHTALKSEEITVAELLADLNAKPTSGNGGGQHVADVSEFMNADVQLTPEDGRQDGPPATSEEYKKWAEAKRQQPNEPRADRQPQQPPAESKPIVLQPAPETQKQTASPVPPVQPQTAAPVDPATNVFETYKQLIPRVRTREQLQGLLEKARKDNENLNDEQFDVVQTLILNRIETIPA